MEAHAGNVARQGGIVHHVPGRLRIRVMDPHADADFFSEVKQAIGALSGVDSVRVNLPTASIVVDYLSSDTVFLFRLQDDPNVKAWLSIDKEVELAALISHAVTTRMPYSESHSRLAEAIVSVAENLNIGLRQATDGYLDLKVLLPLGIAIGTSLHKARGRGTPMWITLGTFAFNSFLTMHHQRIDAPIVRIFSRPARRA